MKIGVISDTHGFLDPKVARLFHGVDHILHAGDIGPATIIRELEQIAPVTAVLGNNDFSTEFREMELATLGELRCFIHHIVNPASLPESLRRRIEKDAPHAVLFGHTHKAFCEWSGGRLFFNPGYAGRPRFQLARSVGFLSWDGAKLIPEIKPL